MTISHAVLPVTLFALVCMIPRADADVPADQAAEVENLISRLETSDCRMVRNGKSYNGEDAANHVRRKYDYFRARISSTEEFIECAATKSTMSKKYYEVQCPGEEPVPSSEWLLQELKEYRARQAP